MAIYAVFGEEHERKHVALTIAFADVLNEAMMERAVVRSATDARLPLAHHNMVYTMVYTADMSPQRYGRLVAANFSEETYLRSLCCVASCTFDENAFSLINLDVASPASREAPIQLP